MAEQKRREGRNLLRSFLGTKRDDSGGLALELGARGPRQREEFRVGPNAVPPESTVTIMTTPTVATVDELRDFESRVETTSLAADEAQHGGSMQLMYMIMSQVTSLLALQVVTPYILAATDQFFLAFMAATCATIIIRMLSEIILFVFEPADSSGGDMDVRKLGTWLNTMLLLLQILFFTALYTTMTILFSLFQSLFVVDAQNNTIAIMMLIVVVGIVLAFIAHPSINLVTHLAPLIKPVGRRTAADS